jgi:hypothetical protein
MPHRKLPSLWRDEVDDAVGSRDRPQDVGERHRRNIERRAEPVGRTEAQAIARKDVRQAVGVDVQRADDGGPKRAARRDQTAPRASVQAPRLAAPHCDVAEAVAIDVPQSHGGSHVGTHYRIRWLGAAGLTAAKEQDVRLDVHYAPVRKGDRASACGAIERDTCQCVGEAVAIHVAGGA